MPFPAMSGADPWIGSNIDGWRRSGLMLPLGAIPRLPDTAAPRSVRMSPNRFDATMTSMLAGSVTMRAASASTWYFRHETDGNSFATWSRTWSQSTIERSEEHTSELQSHHDLV